MHSSAYTHQTVGLAPPPGLLHRVKPAGREGKMKEKVARLRVVIYKSATGCELVDCLFSGIYKLTSRHGRDAL